MRKTEVFRERLLEELSNSGYVQANGKLEEIAHQLGVLPETLFEAKQRALFREKKILASSGAKICQIIFLTQRRTLVDWNEFCLFRKLNGPGLIRGVLHSYLKGSSEFDSLIRTTDTGDDDMLVTNVTFAARQALHARARNLSVPYAYILRTIMYNIRKGIFSPNEIEPLLPQDMFTDVNSYYLPPASTS